MMQLAMSSNERSGQHQKPGLAQLSALISPFEIRLLSAIGFMAARSGHIVPSLRIFESLALHRPSSAFPYVGMVTAYLAVGLHGEAIQLLNGALRSNPEQRELGLWLALAYQQSGDVRSASREFANWQETSGSSHPVNSIAEFLGKALGAGTANRDWPVPATVVE